jgi:hypothetical protein
VLGALRTLTLDAILRTMRVVAALAGLLVSCHLADDIDPPKCEKGFHPELGKCNPDETTEIRVTISAAGGGTSCTGDPASQRSPELVPELVRVKVNEQFQFENKDVVDHEIRGTDGTSWVPVPAGKLSRFMSIVKAGTFGYRVSGCTKGGSVAVD